MGKDRPGLKRPCGQQIRTEFGLLHTPHLRIWNLLPSAKRTIQFSIRS